MARVIGYSRLGAERSSEFELPPSVFTRKIIRFREYVYEYISRKYAAHQAILMVTRFKYLYRAGSRVIRKLMK